LPTSADQMRKMKLGMTFFDTAVTQSMKAQHTADHDSGWAGEGRGGEVQLSNITIKLNYKPGKRIILMKTLNLLRVLYFSF